MIPLRYISVMLLFVIPIPLSEGKPRIDEAQSSSKTETALNSFDLEPLTSNSIVYAEPKQEPPTSISKDSAADIISCISQAAYHVHNVPEPFAALLHKGGALNLQNFKEIFPLFIRKASNMPNYSECIPTLLQGILKSPNFKELLPILLHESSNIPNDSEIITPLLKAIIDLPNSNELLSILLKEVSDMPVDRKFIPSVLKAASDMPEIVRAFMKVGTEMPEITRKIFKNYTVPPEEISKFIHIYEASGGEDLLDLLEWFAEFIE